eukprot:Hpha_TRINITY_DN12349_c1_g1::TRINITY_DN12349_c1_g1_i1::g.156046::m.156046
MPLTLPGRSPGGAAAAAAAAARLRIGQSGEDLDSTPCTPKSPAPREPRAAPPPQQVFKPPPPLHQQPALHNRQASHETEQSQSSLSNLSTGRPVTVADRPVAVADRPVAVADRPVAVPDRPVAVADREAMRQHGADFARHCARFQDDVLGRGAFGIVYKGQNATTGQILAIKTMTAPSSSVLSEIEREYDLLVRLSHPNVVETLAFHYDEAAGQASIFMEYVAGGSLCGVISKYSGGDLKGLPEMLIRRYTCDILRGLCFAHLQEIIHRDIKPANMLIDTCGTLKLADFGLCKQVSDHTSVKNPNSVVGTVRYMSPGSIQRRYTVASDVWAVGCSLTEMTSGLPPYHGQPEDAMQLLFAIGQGRLRPEVPTTSNGQPVTEDLLSFAVRCFEENKNSPEKYPRSSLCEELLRHPFCLSQPATLPEPRNPNLLPSQRPTASISSTAPPASELEPESGSFALHHNPGTQSTVPARGPFLQVTQPTMSSVSVSLGCIPRQSSIDDEEQALAGIAELAQMPNTQVSMVESPEGVLHDLLTQGCDEEICEELRACMLFVSLRYLAVLFLDSQPGGAAHYRTSAVQEVVGVCLPLVSEAVARKPGASPPSLLCLLGALCSGLELLKAAAASTEQDEWVQMQTLASAAFLDPNSGDEARQKVMRNYTFLVDPRGCCLFTQIFLLLVPHPHAPSLEQVSSLSQVLCKLLRNERQRRASSHEGMPLTPSKILSTARVEGDQWKVVWAVVEHLTQCALNTVNAAVHNAVIGSADEPDSVGLETLLLESSVCHLHVRVKIIESGLTILHARTRTPLRAELREHLMNFILAVAVHKSTDTRLARPLAVTDALPRMLMQRAVYDWVQTEYAPAMDYSQQAKQHADLPDFLELLSRRRHAAAVKVGGLAACRSGSGSEAHQSFRHASSFSTQGGDLTQTHTADELMTAVKAAAAELAAKSRYKYDVIFQEDDHITWDLFFARIAHTHPYNQQPHFYNIYRHLFPLVRYLMQGEGDEPDLNAPRQHVRYEEDWKPFQTYFPMESMFEDISFLNDNCYLHLHSHTKLLDRALKGRPRGSFLIRPSKREPGRLVLTAMVKGQNRSEVRLTHKIIYLHQETQHLVVHQFPVTFKAASRKLVGVKDLLVWLHEIAPDDFQSGAGTRVLPGDEGLYSTDAYCDEIAYGDEFDGP